MQHNKTINILAVTAAALALSACDIEQDPVPSKKEHFAGMEDYEYNLDSFTHINIEASSKLTITVGEEQFVTVSTKPEHIEHITVELIDGELVVQHVGEHSDEFYTDINIGVKELNFISVNSVTAAYVTGIDSEFIEVNFDGIGEFELTGRCNTAKFLMDGIGELDARNLICEDVEASIDGIGSASIHANGSINIQADGIGDVNIYGDPKIESATFDGIGDFEFK